MLRLASLALVLSMAPLMSCKTAPAQSSGSEPKGVAAPPSAASLSLTSSSFSPGGAIAAAYTCDGDGKSPALAWSAGPAATQSYALIVVDPDAPSGTFTHWVLFDMAASTSSLIENASAGEAGKNDFGKAGYGGPCPPKGKGAHRYFFRLYALDVAKLGEPAGASRAEVEKAMTGHVVARGELMGTYERK